MAQHQVEVFWRAAGAEVLYRHRGMDHLGLAPATELLREDYESLAARAARAGADFFLHRDFQSMNLKLYSGALWIIDFQGARFGPPQYDLASFLFDPYVELPAELRDDPVLYGECLGGALYWNDFLSLAKRQGFIDPRLVEHRPLAITNPELEARLGAIRFLSATYRLFKLDEIEADGEDYGQTVTYLGRIAEQPDAFQLDAHHRFATGQESPVSGNTWRMLHDTRFAAHFKFSGDFTRHRGLFEKTAMSDPFAAAAPSTPEPVKTGCC